MRTISRRHRRDPARLRGTAGRAKTPKDTLVQAYRIDDIITLDPAEFRVLGHRVRRPGL